MPEPSAELKAKALELGFTTCGICSAEPPASFGFLQHWLTEGFGADMSYLSSDLRKDPGNLLPGVRSVIAVTLNYYQPLSRQPGQPKIARYALGRDYHKVIRGKLRKLAAWLGTKYPAGEFRACVDSAPILEREFANRAGLGWFGKNTCLIDTHRGSWFFIGLLLSTLEFEPDAAAQGGCGTCTRCIDACPTGAIVQLDNRWCVDSRRCISSLTIEKRGAFSPQESGWVGDWTFGCDVCQEVCPFNQPREMAPNRGQVTTEPGFLAKRDWPGLEQLAQISHEDFARLTEGSPVRRAKAEGLRRNAAAKLAAQEAVPS